MITFHQQRTKLHPHRIHMAKSLFVMYCMDTYNVIPTSFAHHKGGGNHSMSNPTLNQSETSVEMF